MLDWPAYPIRVDGRTSAKWNARASLHAHVIATAIVSIVLVGGLAIWAAATPIAGAVMAPGAVIVEGGPRRVQHAEGGIVSEIMVRSEDRVEAGQLLVRLADTATRANLAIIMSQLDEVSARHARLRAESTGAEMTLPSETEGTFDLYKAENDLRLSRQATLEGQIAGLSDQSAQLQGKLEGLGGRKAALERELAIVAGEATDAKTLLSRGLIEATRVNATLRDQAQLEGEIGSVAAEIAQTRAAIAEHTTAGMQVRDEFRSGVLAELQATAQSINELLQQKVAAEDKLARLEIRAPQRGVVHESRVQTIGGVISAGETLMLIVPDSSRVSVEVRVSPLDIDKIRLGQPAALRFGSFDPRVAPELNAAVSGVSPDLSSDPVTHQTYYALRIDVPPGEVSRLPEGSRLLPGMPVEALMGTGARTVLQYLIQPLAEQFGRAFRQD